MDATNPCPMAMTMYILPKIDTPLWLLVLIGWLSGIWLGVGIKNRYQMDMCSTWIGLRAKNMEMFMEIILSISYPRISGLIGKSNHLELNYLTHHQLHKAIEV